MSKWWSQGHNQGLAPFYSCCTQCILKGMVCQSGHDPISTLLTPINGTLVVSTYHVDTVLQLMLILSIVSFNTTESTGAGTDAFSPPPLNILFNFIYYLAGHTC